MLRIKLNSSYIARMNKLSIARRHLLAVYFYRPFEDPDRTPPRCSSARWVDPARSCEGSFALLDKLHLYPCAPRFPPSLGNPEDISLSSLWARWDRSHCSPCQPRKPMERYLAGLFSDSRLIAKKEDRTVE